MKQKITFFLLKLAGYFPTRIPVGLTEFETWAKKILILSKLPVSERSLKWTLAQKVMALPAHQNKIAVNKMVASIQKGAANEVASYVFQTIKQEQQAELEAARVKAETEKKAAEEKAAAEQQAADTAPTQVPENEQKT